MRSCLTMLLIACFAMISLHAKHKHRITAIFTDGEAIQLDDGSAWGIGYWTLQNISDRPIVATRWRAGDNVEFYTEWKGAFKIWFYITNLRTEETVNGWLMHGPYVEKTLLAKDYDKKGGVLRLSNCTLWSLNQAWFDFNPFHVTDVITGRVFLLKKHQEEAYYLLKAGSYAAEGVEIKPITLQP